MDYFRRSFQHILAELERIDLLVRLQVWRARQLQAVDAEFQGLYISDQEVDLLLSQAIGRPAWTTEPLPPSLPEIREAQDRLAADIARRKTQSVELGIPLRLDLLARLFTLSPFEVDVLLLSLAPELDLRYQKLYAYLQDDLTRKWPGVDLVLNLLCPSFEAKVDARRYLAPGAPLLRHSLLHLLQDPAQPPTPLLGRYLQVDERVTRYLLDSDEPDLRLAAHVRCLHPRTRLADLLLPQDIKARLLQAAGGQAAGQERTTGAAAPIFYFEGPYGTGKQAAAEALCGELGLSLLVVDGEALLRSEGPSFEEAVDLVQREALLQGAALYWQGFDALMVTLGEQTARQQALLYTLNGWQRLTFLAGATAWTPAGLLLDPGSADGQQPFLHVHFPRPSYAERLQIWTRSLAEEHALPGAETLAPDLDLPGLANKFRFSGGQIRDAVVTARNLARWRDPVAARVETADLYAASRMHSNRSLGTLAQKIVPHYTWDDIVLPEDQVEQLRAICSFVKHRARVYDDWGFDHKLSLGKGLNALFAGPSGTGKTMAAEIVAHELGLDLYKIDLSGVVSKYIGETEKNLARIFAEAETSNAILFFDEADALFGKRSEVKDAHDRYANIEISYLLQKMEEYDGVVILATNLRHNLDDAFVRRMAFTLNFPFPEEADRRRIWNGIWPAEAPLGSDVDLDFLARQFKLTGGNIKNIALGAAFLAAEDGQVVNMAHLVAATRRELQKMGKAVPDRDFAHVR
jgi:SpoVK/Ycf46/Vps4 family AAA+-type ATPase